MPCYFVVEIQKWADGTWHNIVYQYEDRMQAEAKYHYVLSESAVSSIPVNGASLLNALTGACLMYKVYQHGEYEETEE